MKNLLLMVIALTLVFMVSENTFAQEYEPSADEVGVFTEPNFQGECRKYNTGYSPRPFYEKWNNSISSIKVGANAKIWICQAIDFEGVCEMLEKNDSSLGNNKVGDNQISSFKVSLKSAPKDDEPEAIENEENYLITRNSVGNIKFGMTVGEAKKILKGSTFGSVPVGEGEGAEIGLFVDEKLRLTIGYWEEPEPQIDSAGVILGYKLPPINENQKITWISINDPRYKTAEGVHLGMKIAEAEKHYGKPILTQTAISHVWEIGKFTNQPKYLSFGFKSNDVYDSVGIYGDTPNCGDEYEPECRKTNKYNPGSYISAMSISTPQND